jgi:multiple sugar transport system ATP-binding protein
MATLAIRALNKRFGSLNVLKDINLEVEDGEFVVLVGPSGCGKSTLLNIIAGLEQESGGSIRIGDRLMSGVAPKDRNIAMVFQSYALYPTMTVRQNITFGMECRGSTKNERIEAVARVARLLQIEKLLDRKPGQLSGGQRQRVAIGRALVREPELFLFDEPLSNLDAKLRVEMRWEIKQLHHKIGATIVYVTHDQIEAMTMATRIAVMHHGEVQQFASPDTIYNRPANLFVARFMGAPPMNTFLARLDDRDGNPVARLSADSPEEIVLPLSSHISRDLKDREVILGIRPECIGERLRRFGDDPRASHPIMARVEMTEPTGAETVVLMRIGKERALGRVSADVSLSAGQTAQFALDTRKICLFDIASERLIA